jgi:ribosomal protein S9
MILTYPNYLEQSQVIGLNAMSEYHSVCVDVVTPYPLLITISKATEYDISITHSGGGS